jgi:hypothetical protein
VILGASNLVRGITTVFETSTRCWGGPLDFLAAHGHGRSYGGESMFLGRVLPGINTCGLWEALDNRPPAPTAALLTDVGNDILYGAPVERIAEWVDLCLARLAPQCARIVVTELPVHGVHALTPSHYNLVRTLFFPQCRLPLADAVDRAVRLNERLCELADRYGAVRIKPRAEWYGLDPIHIRFRHLGPAWREIFASWCEGDPPACAPSSWRRWLLLKRLRPLYRRVFGFEQRQTQPVARLRDGSVISYF